MERHKKNMIMSGKMQKIDVSSTIVDVIGILEIGSTKDENIWCLLINYFNEIPYTNVYMNESFSTVHKFHSEMK